MRCCVRFFSLWHFFAHQTTTPAPSIVLPRATDRLTTLGPTFHCHLYAFAWVLACTWELGFVAHRSAWLLVAAPQMRPTGCAATARICSSPSLFAWATSAHDTRGAIDSYLRRDLLSSTTDRRQPSTTALLPLLPPPFLPRHPPITLRHQPRLSKTGATSPTRAPWLAGLAWCACLLTLPHAGRLQPHGDATSF